MKTFLILMMVLLIGCTTISPNGTVMRDATGNAWASLLLPGAGQFYNKENGKGLLYLGLATTSYISWMNSEKTVVNWPYITTYRDNTWLYCLGAISVLSAIDAFHSSQRYNLELSLSPDKVRIEVNHKF